MFWPGVATFPSTYTVPSNELPFAPVLVPHALGPVATRSYWDSVSSVQPVPGAAQSNSVYSMPSHRK